MDSNSSMASMEETKKFGCSIAEEGDELPTINDTDVYCLDGGFASHLPTHYKEPVDNDPLWSCRALHTNTEAVIKTHKDFVLAGADIITTNTYQASAEHLRKYVGPDMSDPIIGPHVLLEEAVKLARKGAEAAGKIGSKPFVAGSVGPYGACLCDGSEYNGNYLKLEHPLSKPLGADENAIREFLRNWHRDRIKRLRLGGANIHAVETMPGSLEALAILDVLEEFPGTKAWISFQCQEGGLLTAVGEKIEDAFCALVEHRSFRFKVVAVGANCVNPTDVTEILRCYNRVNNWNTWANILHYKKVPYVVYPNAGRKWDGNSKSWISQESQYGSNASDILENIALWIKLGANIIGGCCQVGPEITKLISNKINLEMFDAIQARHEEESKNTNPNEEWSSVLERLEKPRDTNRKDKERDAKDQQERFRIRDVTGVDGGEGVFSRMHHDMENIIRNNEKKNTNNIVISGDK